jgi:hypothetical protein
MSFEVITATNIEEVPEGIRDKVMDCFGNYGEYTVLLVIRNGVVILQEWDGGEPEDNSFSRDWSWVPETIENAYNLGFKDGLQDGR